MSPENYRLDGEPRALYYAPYRKTYEELKAILKTGEVIPNYFFVSFLGNNSLLPTSFDLRKVDRQPIGNFEYPGKSAHITFTDNLVIACGAVFDRKAKRTDHLYTTQAKDLEDLGFFAVYLPLPNIPLHIRVIHAAQRKNPKTRDIPYKSRVGLVALLKEHKIL